MHLLGLIAWLAATPPPPAAVRVSDLIFPMPDGYVDMSAELSAEARGMQMVAIAAKETAAGLRPTIVFQKSPVAAGIQDVAICTQTGNSVAVGVKGKLKHARVIAGPVGKACQMEIVAPQGVALVTELDLPAETWLMTCNHSVGDGAAEKICRQTLSKLKLKRPGVVAPK